MVEGFFDIIHADAGAGDDVKLSGFGNFNIRRSAPARAQPERTGESIPSRRATW